MPVIYYQVLCINALFTMIRILFFTASVVLRDTILNQNASFTCNTTVPAKWLINKNETIYTTNHPPVPDELSNRGFVLSVVARSMETLNFVTKLIVFGSFQNNQTEIDCWKLLDNTEPVKSFIINVIGIFDVC